MQAPAGASPDRRLTLVRDGFHVWAFLAPVLWLAWHRLWAETLVLLAITLGLGALADLKGIGWAAPLLTVLVSIYVGLDGAGFRIAALRRRGFVERGVIDAEDRDAAEMRYFLGGGAEEEAAPSAIASAAQSLGSPRPSAPALGLLQYPGR